MEELIIEVDRHNKPIGLRPRTDFHGGKRIHRGAHLLLFNSSGKLLLQKRPDTMRLYPGVYTASVSGFVDNESTETCIQREMQEEIGLQAPVKELFTFFHTDQHDSAFATVYTATSDGPLTFNEHEVAGHRWVALIELEEELAEHPERFSPVFRQTMKIFFER
jgi:isopentenyl-diphosphate Delta-isomerase